MEGRKFIMVLCTMERIIRAGEKGSNRFPRCERLRRQRDFERCVRNGRAIKGRLLTLHVYWHGEPMRRVAFSVGKAVGKAVARNRIKRWLREAYRTRRWALKSGFDLLVVAHQRCSSAVHEEVDSEFERLILRADLVDERSHMMAGEITS